MKCERAGRLHTAVSALLLTLLVMAVSYLFENSDFPLGGETSFVKHFEAVVGGVKPGAGAGERECLMVNTGFDKQLVARYDEEGFLVGNEAFTDRALLLDFLERLAEEPDYRAVVFDLDLSRLAIEGRDSVFVAQNKRLAALLARMERVVVAQTVDDDGSLLPLIDSALEHKSGVVPYVRTFLETEVVAVPLISHGHPSLPLKLAQVTDGVRMTRWGPFFRWNGKLCHKRVFPMDYTGNFESSVGEVQRYENLGSDIMAYPELISVRTEDRIVLIGDFENDVHDTYVGAQPGSVILYNAYLSALDGHHCLPWWWRLSLFVIYFILSFFLFRKGAKVEREQRSRFLRFIVLLLGYTALFWPLKVIAFSMLHIDYNIVLPEMMFVLFNMYQTSKSR